MGFGPRSGSGDLERERRKCILEIFEDKIKDVTSLDGLSAALSDEGEIIEKKYCEIMPDDIPGKEYILKCQSGYEFPVAYECSNCGNFSTEIPKIENDEEDYYILCGKCNITFAHKRNNISS